MSEEFSDEEVLRLAPFFTNVDRPVFGLKLPQEVSGALFSRYSRSAKSLRRVFLDEFAGAELPDGAREEDPEALARARAFYDRVLVGYGDDSVAQLGGAHVAVERVSNVAAKVIEDSRIGVAFLEKSTRYVRFDQKGADGEYLFHREEAVCSSRHREAYLALMRLLFDTYAAQIEPMAAHIRRLLPIEKVELRHPKTGEPLPWAAIEDDAELRKQAERAYQSTVRAHACDVMRSYLPGATLTNLGIFAAGQAWEHLLDRLYSNPLAESRALAPAIHRELEQLIPSFVKRAKRSDFLVALAEAGRRAAARIAPSSAPMASVTLVDYDAEAEEKILAAFLYSFGEGSLVDLRKRVAALSPEERRRLLDEVFSLRRHRRDKPPRAFENVFYTFDLLGNFGLYRDLQRHRLLTQERQVFTTAHGYDTPPEIEETGFKPAFDRCMEQAHGLYERLRGELPLEAQYVVPLAYRVRWYMKMNLREAVHLCELRSMPQGHPDYRLVVQEMWRKIEEVHPGLAGVGKFMNRDAYRLGRLQSELRTEYKKSQLA